MGDAMDKYLAKFVPNARAAGNGFGAIERHFGCVLPGQYKEFMAARDGGEGFVGDNYLVVWRIGELIEFNKDYQVAEFAPGLVLFGTDGGGEAFAFDTREGEGMQIRVVPQIGMEFRCAKAVARTFGEFIERLARPGGILE